MFQANIPEKIIQKTTGHRSVEALRTNEQMSTEQFKSVSKILMLYSDSEPQKENREVAKPECSSNLSRVLGDMTNCTIQNLTINVNPSITIHKTAKEIEEEFDALVTKI